MANLARKNETGKRTIPPHEMQMRQLISYNFQRLMEKHKLVPKDLCEAYTCNASYVSQIVNCNTSISLQALYKWATIFNENVIEFFRPAHTAVIEPLIDKIITHPDMIPLVEALLDAHINIKTIKPIE